MSGLIRQLRLSPGKALWGAGMLMCLVGLTAMHLESAFCGHDHIVGGHVYHHRHLYFGAHEHPGAQHDPGHGTPARGPRETPRPTASVSLVPALIQPLRVRVLAAPSVESISVASVLRLHWVAGPTNLRILLRGPPGEGRIPSLARAEAGIVAAEGRALAEPCHGRAFDPCAEASLDPIRGLRSVVLRRPIGLQGGAGQAALSVPSLAGSTSPTSSFNPVTWLSFQTCAAQAHRVRSLP
jgi:hypothetical protein